MGIAYKHSQPRPTVYRGIAMRSRLEADLAKHLDARGIVWEYEPMVFADGQQQYLPDFCWLEADGRLAYVEAKPAEIFLDQPDLDRALNRMTVIWASEPDASLTLLGMGWVPKTGYRPEAQTWAVSTSPPMTWRVRFPLVATPWFDYRATP